MRAGSFVWVVLGGLALGVTGCEPSTLRCQPDAGPARPCGNDAGPGDAAGADALVPSGSLTLDPPSVLIDLSAGDPTSVSFSLRRDGAPVDVDSASWSLDTPALGSVNRGTFVADGGAGGVGTVEARVGDDVARARVEVVVDRTVRGDGVGSDVPARFGTPVAGEGAPQILYPLEGALMPRNVRAPEVHWSPVGAMGDVFRVRCRRPHAVVAQYVLHTGASFRHAVPIDAESWELLTASDPDAPVTIEVDRLEASSGRVIAGAAPRSIRIARGSLYGAVYYWNLRDGDVRRIDPEGGPTVDLIPNPPGELRCVACHALSRDGRYLWGNRAGDWTQMMFDLTADLSGDPAPTVFPVAGNYFTATFDPTSRYLVTSASFEDGGYAGPLFLLDARTGGRVPTTGLPPTGTTYPEWSPTGDRLAYVGNVLIPAGSLHPGDSDLMVMPVLPTDPPSFGAATMVHDGASLSGAPERGSVDCHPSFSPDGRYLAFQHGPGCFSTFSGTEGALYLADLELHTITRLDIACGGADAIDNFWPAFGPYTTLEADGHRHHWLGFFSRRRYGNEVAGSAGNRQLWVTAIDADRTTGDPSMVPYWLPGQATTDNNLAAQWAPDACRSVGDACSEGALCCTGTCTAGRCAPPESECRAEGETCGASSDCCAELDCMGLRCLPTLF